MLEELTDIGSLTCDGTTCCTQDDYGQLTLGRLLAIKEKMDQAKAELCIADWAKNHPGFKVYENPKEIRPENPRSIDVMASDLVPESEIWLVSQVKDRFGLMTPHICRIKNVQVEGAKT